MILQETHILHEFREDFYGSQLSVCMVGYIRNEMNFSSTGISPSKCLNSLVTDMYFIEELISAIKNDIKFAEMKLSNVPLSQEQVNFFGKTQTANNNA